MNYLLSLLLMRLSHCYRYYPLVRSRRGRLLFSYASAHTGPRPTFAFCGSLFLSAPTVLKSSRVRRYNYGFDPLLTSQKTVSHAERVSFNHVPAVLGLTLPIIPYGGWGSKTPHREYLRAALAVGCLRTVSSPAPRSLPGHYLSLCQFWLTTCPWAAVLAAQAFFSPVSCFVTPANPGAFFLAHMPVSEAGWAAFCSYPVGDVSLFGDLGAEGNCLPAHVADSRDINLEDLIYHRRTRLALSSSYAAWG
jgi:hypothetical protein